jgi:hypothetical protein
MKLLRPLTAYTQYFLQKMLADAGCTTSGGLRGDVQGSLGIDGLRGTHRAWS